MVSRYRYRIVSVTTTLLFAVLSVLVANHPSVQALTTVVPVFRRLPATVLTGNSLVLAVGTTVTVVVACLVPLYKPRPRRVLDTVLLTQKRILVAGLVLATIGYFDYTYRLPRSTLVLAIGALFISLPFWFVTIRHRPSQQRRAIIIGDAPNTILDAFDIVEIPVVGYVAPPNPYYTDSPRNKPPTMTDGSHTEAFEDLNCLGGLSRLNEVLVEYDVDTAILAFTHLDRSEFFGALDVCYEHGVEAKIPRDHADDVLTTPVSNDKEIVDIELEPWDWQDYAFKRAFDVLFASAGLLALCPLIIVIVVAIKLDSPGPVLYSQERTTLFGETFQVYKFRSMVPNAESETGAVLSEEDVGGTDHRVTRVGRIIRRTHLDEIPQLWTILTGEMSVVGPRPERPEIDSTIESNVDEWRYRWFLKPGLTGLAQINGMSGHEPRRKLQYDLEYLRRQSLRLDVSIVLKQILLVVGDLIPVDLNPETEDE